MRIGIVTLCALRGQKQQNLEKIVRFGETAAAQGCRLVLFPEFSVTGPWVSYDPEAELKDLQAQMEPVPGPTTEFLSGHARRLGIAFCVGLPEKGLASKPFNAQVVVDATGVIHIQRKLQPTVSEVPFYRGGGDAISTFTLQDRCFGTVICADNGNRAIHEHLYGQGARVFLAPHAGAIKKYQEPGRSWEELVAWHRAHNLSRYPDKARTLGATFLYCDMKDPREGFEDHPEWIHYVSGKSAVFAPSGDWIAENAGNAEVLITVDV